MAGHDYEYIVDNSISFLSELPHAEDLDLRSWFAALYKFRSRYDTGFTHFHIIGHLVKHRYAYAFALEEHPEYARYRDVLQTFRGFRGIYRDPTSEWDEQDNPKIGYYCDPVEEWGTSYTRHMPTELRRGRLYCDAGSELWQAFVAAGKLTGRDAEPPKEIPIQKVVAMIATQAAACGDRLLVRQWLPVLCYDLAPLGRAALSADPDVQTLRRIAKQMDVLSMQDEDLEDSIFLIPPDDDFEDDETVTWWLALEDV